jgi:hypothetical protein
MSSAALGRCRQRGASSDTGRSERVYTRAHGVGQRRPARPIGAQRYATLMMASGPRASAISELKITPRQK